MNTKTEKQARLDAFEIREKWPSLRIANFFSLNKLVNVRRASVALNNADINQCNDRDQQRAEKRCERAERRAKKAIAELQAEIADAFLASGVIVSLDFVRIAESGYGFRYIELSGLGNRYSLID